jgi:hypothetical protein
VGGGNELERDENQGEEGGEKLAEHGDILLGQCKENRIKDAKAFIALNAPGLAKNTPHELQQKYSIELASY